MLLATDGPNSQASCGDLKASQGQAIDISVLSRGSFPTTPAQPPAIIYQAIAGKPCSYQPPPGVAFSPLINTFWTKQCSTMITPTKSFCSSVCQPMKGFCLTCRTGGACSYAHTTLNLSILCYVPDQLPVSKLLAGVVKPAISRQLDALQHKLELCGKIQPWTAFQVYILNT